MSEETNGMAIICDFVQGGDYNPPRSDCFRTWFDSIEATNQPPRPTWIIIHDQMIQLNI